MAWIIYIHRNKFSPPSMGRTFAKVWYRTSLALLLSIQFRSSVLCAAVIPLHFAQSLYRFSSGFLRLLDQSSNLLELWYLGISHALIQPALACCYRDSCMRQAAKGDSHFAFVATTHAVRQDVDVVSHFQQIQRCLGDADVTFNAHYGDLFGSTLSIVQGGLQSRYHH